MSNVEKADHSIPPVKSIIAEITQIRNDADVGQLSHAEFDDWLKHNIVKYRYPLLGAAVIYLGAVVIYSGWMAYRFVKKIISKEQPKS